MSQYDWSQYLRSYKHVIKHYWLIFLFVKSFWLRPILLLHLKQFNSIINHCLREGSNKRNCIILEAALLGHLCLRLTTKDLFVNFFMLLCNTIAYRVGQFKILALSFMFIFDVVLRITQSRDISIRGVVTLSTYFLDSI